MDEQDVSSFGDWLRAACADATANYVPPDDPQVRREMHLAVGVPAATIDLVDAKSSPPIGVVIDEEPHRAKCRSIYTYARPAVSSLRRAPRPREHRARRGTRTASRGSPSRLDDPPDLDQGTALQRAWRLFLDALQIAREAGGPVLLVFLNLAATRVAAELAPLLRWRERDAA